MATTQDLRRLRGSIRRRARLVGFGLGVLALTAFAWAAWANGLGSRVVCGAIITLSATAIAFFAAKRPGWARRIGVAALGGLVYWPVLVTIGAMVILAKSGGEFDEGGPAGLAVVVGVYLAAPILVVAVTFAPLLGLLLERGRQALNSPPPSR